MIHVAEAGEAKGRVVVQLCTNHPSPIAIEAAVWLAHAFQSEIESLYVENESLIELARYPFAREVSLSGRDVRAINCEDIERQFRFASTAFHAAIEAVARAVEVPVRFRVVRGEPISALSETCAACGPWNAIALAEPFTSPSCPSLKALFENVQGTTGLVIVGPNARRTDGPLVIALERADLLSAMLNAAERLATVRECEITVCLLASDEWQQAELDEAARLALAERPNIKLASGALALGAEAAAIEALRRLHPGLVIGQYGGLLVPAESDLRALASGLECPLLLMR